MEDRRKCFKCGCSPANDGVKLFRFPKPGLTNLIRCLLWAKYIFPEKDYSSLSFHKKLHSEHRMLCQRHFKNTDFADNSKTKLLRTAVPNDVECLDGESDSQTYSSVEQQKPFSDIDLQNTETGLDQKAEVYEPVTRLSSASYNAILPVVEQRHTESATLPDLASTSGYQSTPADILMSETVDSQADHRYSKRRHIDHTYTKDKPITDSVTSELSEQMASPGPAEEDTDSPVELQEVCRVCLAYNVKMYRVQEYNLCQMLYDVTGLKVGENEGIFQNVCFECAARLSAAAAFRDKALTSYAILRRLLNSIDAITSHDIEHLKENLEILKPTLTVQEVFYTADIEPSDADNTNHDNMDIQNEDIDQDDVQPMNYSNKLVSTKTVGAIYDKHKDIVKTYCDVETIDNFNITQRCISMNDDGSVAIENIAINDGNIAISDENIAINDENIALGDENIAISDENIAINDENIAIGDENITMSDESITMSDESIAIGDENINNFNNIFDPVVHETDKTTVDEQNSSKNDSSNLINTKEELIRTVIERLKKMKCSKLSRKMKKDLAEEFNLTPEMVQNIFDNAELKKPFKDKQDKERKNVINRISEEQKKKVISLRTDGVIISDIVKQTGVSRASIYGIWRNWCKENNDMPAVTTVRKDDISDQDLNISTDLLSQDYIEYW